MTWKRPLLIYPYGPEKKSEQLYGGLAIIMRHAMTKEDALRCFARAFNTLDVSELEYYLGEDVTYDAEHVGHAFEGKEAVCHFLATKIGSLKKAGPERRVHAELGVSVEGKKCVILSRGHPENVRAVALLVVRDEAIEGIEVRAVTPGRRSPKGTGEFPR